MKVSTIIKRLGGPTAVGKHCGVRPQAVSFWISKNRIPAERVPQLIRMATSLGFTVSPSQLRRDVDWGALV